jgi:hypothetical protein
LIRTPLDLSTLIQTGLWESEGGFQENQAIAKVDAVAQFRTEPRVACLLGGARTPLSLAEREVIRYVEDGLDAHLLQFFGRTGMESWQVTDVVF